MGSNPGYLFYFTQFFLIPIRLIINWFLSNIKGKQESCLIFLERYILQFFKSIVLKIEKNLCKEQCDCQLGLCQPCVPILFWKNIMVCALILYCVKYQIVFNADLEILKYDPFMYCNLTKVLINSSDNDKKKLLILQVCVQRLMRKTATKLTIVNQSVDPIMNVLAKILVRIPITKTHWCVFTIFVR